MSTQISSPAALLSGETMRMRNLAWAIFAIGALGLAMIPFVPFTPAARLALAVSTVADMATAVWMRWLLDSPHEDTDRRMAPPWIVLVTSNAVVIVCLGIFSAAPIICVLSNYFVTQRYGARLTLSLAVLGALLHLLPTVLIGAGVIADPGLLSVNHLPKSVLVAGETLILSLFAMSHWIARVSRRATVLTLNELQAATRAAARREALLIEAREELERALHAGGPGRFTDQVLGSFRLGALLGRGAMGEVYEAEGPEGQPAAVKLLRHDALAQPGLLERFLREARAVAALRSPHVVRVIETGDETAPLPYIAMERLVGYDLAGRLRARARLPAPEIVELVRQVARGVDAVHRVGIVHRDLKPQNLFWHRPSPSAPGMWKVLDFGVSKLSGESGTLTAGKIVGTPAYMAPEQVRGGAVDERTDVYALAVIAFRCLTGEVPFRGSDAAQIYYQIAHAPAPAPSGCVPSLPSAVDVVLLRGLHKDRAARFASAGELAAALTAALGYAANDSLDSAHKQ